MFTYQTIQAYTFRKAGIDYFIYVFIHFFCCFLVLTLDKFFVTTLVLWFFIYSVKIKLLLTNWIGFFFNLNEMMFVNTVHSDWNMEMVDDTVFFCKTLSSYYLMVVYMWILSITPSAWNQESLESPPVGDWLFLERYQEISASEQEGLSFVLKLRPSTSLPLSSVLTSSLGIFLSLFFAFKPHTFLFSKHSMCVFTHVPFLAHPRSWYHHGWLSHFLQNLLKV